MSLGVLAAGLVGCVSLPPLTSEDRGRLCEPIYRALTSNPEDLRHAAETGSAEAQLSWSIVLLYGLQGQAVDLAQSAHWRDRASASRGQQTNAIYIPGYKGHPGSVSLINSPIYALAPRQIEVVADCLIHLGVAPGTNAPPDACGTPGQSERLQQLWASARQ